MSPRGPIDVLQLLCQDGLPKVVLRLACSWSRRPVSAGSAQHLLQILMNAMQRWCDDMTGLQLSDPIALT